VSGTYTEIGKSPITCTLERILQENPFSSSDELGYIVTFTDGSMVTHFDSSTLNSVPLNHECYVLDVTPLKIRAVIAQKFCLVLSQSLRWSKLAGIAHISHLRMKGITTSRTRHTRRRNTIKHGGNMKLRLSVIRLSRKFRPTETTGIEEIQATLARKYPRSLLRLPHRCRSQR